VTFKKLIIILSFVVIGLILTLLSTSYAWYQFDNAVSDFGNVETFSENIELAVIFINDNNIDTTIRVPLFENQIEELSDKTTFTIIPNSEILANKEVAYQISLVDVKIDSALTAVEDLKYSLIEKIGDGTANEITSGNFSGFTGDNIILKEMTAVTSASLDVTHSYEFRLWLQDNGCTLEQVMNEECDDQNDLMGKTILGKIKVSTAIR